MPNFSGTLNSNEIFSALFNMIISQQVFADNVKGTYSQLVDHFRVDGTLYGDTKLYYASDALESEPWTNDAEAGNLLAVKRPNAPACQRITIDQFRHIWITVDNYLSKRAWTDEGAFSSFNSVVLGWIRDTKRIYDSTLMNTYIGTTTTATGSQNIDVEVNSAVGATTGEEAARLEAQAIAKAIADVFVELNDVTREYNDYGYIRSYDDSDLMVIMNAKFLNKLTKFDMPTIFHKDGLMDKLSQYKLPARYFGTPITATNIASYTGNDKPIKDGKYQTGHGVLRTLVEATYTVSEVEYHLFPADELPVGATVTATSNVYVEDGDVICKIIHKDSIPFMSAFEVGTSFYNPRSLTENNYLTWGYSKPEYLKNYPFITLNKD